MITALGSDRVGRKRLFGAEFDEAQIENLDVERT